MLVRMRRLIARASARSPVLQAGFVLLAVLVAGGCAHAPTAADASRTPTRLHVNEEAGFSFALPTTQDFSPGSGRDNVVVSSSAGVRVRLFPEHFVRPPDALACWERVLVRHIPAKAAQRPSTPEGLEQVATGEGLDTGDGRRLFLQVRPRATECVVLVVEGKPEAAAVTAEVAVGSLKVFEPSAQVRRQLLVDAALQLQQMNETEAALDRFATLFDTGDVSPRALALAGAVAFQVGGKRLPLAIAWLERSVSLPPDMAFPNTFPPEAIALYAESLMHLGLAYAQNGQYPEAVARLAEAAVRLPNEPIITYNFACGLALAGQTDDALMQLAAAVRLDPALGTHALTDPDLTSLHATPEWKDIVPATPPDAPVK